MPAPTLLSSYPLFSSYSKLRYRFQLGNGDAQRCHRLGEMTLAKVLPLSMKAAVVRFPNLIDSVILCLAGLEIDLRDLGPFGSHSCNIRQGMRGQP